MPRRFNTAGPCNPLLHYMIPPERRLPEVRQLIDEHGFFTVHAPRQSGKTTSFAALAAALDAQGEYTALLTTCEPAQAAGGDVERGIAAVLDTLRQSALVQLAADRQPPRADPEVPAETRMLDLLSRWSRLSDRPLVLFLDEIDALLDGVLISVLRQLRAGYAQRPGAFPQSVALIGLRDVRDYRISVRPEEQTLGTSSPFNVKVRSLTLENFTADEVAELYGQHTAETGQPFSPAAVERACELTGGQPWLVNALAEQVVNREAPDRALPIGSEAVERAKEVLVQRRGTHLDSLIERLRSPRVRRVLEPLLAGEPLAPDVLDDDVQLVQDLGLIAPEAKQLVIANAIYREIIPRALTLNLERSIPERPQAAIGPGGHLLRDRILDDFRAFWLENAEAYLVRAPYSEAAAQLVFMAFLQKVVNGGGFIDREYAVGSGRIDLCVRWPLPDGTIERWALELKVWRDRRADPLAAGLRQLAAYLERLGLAGGTLILFDGRADAPPLPERASTLEVAHEGRKIAVLRL